jgi:hypothetical protein
LLLPVLPLLPVLADPVADLLVVLLVAAGFDELLQPPATMSTAAAAAIRVDFLETMCNPPWTGRFI